MLLNKFFFELLKKSIFNISVAQFMFLKNIFVNRNKHFENLLTILFYEYLLF